MPTFDVLNLTTPVFGAKILEASAGTGKTFAIEHLFVRLLLEAPANEEPLLIDQILAITFTRAAAREMRMRIRANLEKALYQLKGEVAWPYLVPHIGSLHARRRLEDALALFDHAQIFTIHGFCQRILSEFALEANVFMPTSDENSFRKSIEPSLLEFLEKQTVLCPEQIGHLIGSKKTIDALCKSLLDAPEPKTGGGFAENLQAVQAVIQKCPLQKISWMSEFERLKPHAKISNFKGENFEEQIECLSNLFKGVNFDAALRRLIYWEGSVLRFLSFDNRKLKAFGEMPSEIFDWCNENLLPLIKRASDPKYCLRALRNEWQSHFEEALEQKGLFSPDFLLARMNRALEDKAFVERIQQKYRAAIVDEFQDTDAQQWDIFRKIFFENKRLFYLVGDPKQSIYRFRQADLYTYYRARTILGEQAHYSLDTNYRSTPEMISALNDFFGDEQTEAWLWLPKENRTEAYRPVKAGASHRWNPNDGKKSVQFFQALDLSESTLSYVAQEIIRLKPYVNGFGSFALLAKDRVQAFDAQTYLQSKGLPCWTKNSSMLSRSLAFHALEDLFDVLYFPRDASRLKIFLSGPFVDMTAQELVEFGSFFQPLSQWKALIDEEGLSAFFRAFLAERIKDRTVYERVKERGSEFFSDIFRLIEQIICIRTPSSESLKRFFQELAQADPEEDEDARRRMENDEDAIQIMTMHASKGLEFDVVFVLGVASKTPREVDDPEEAEAEKMRQLYVALTRARFRLYLPVIPVGRKMEGSESPLDLFWRRSKLGQEPLEIIEKLVAKNPYIGFQKEDLEHVIAPEGISSPSLSLSPKPMLSHSHRMIFSYSALAQEKEFSGAAIIESSEKTLHTLPRGSETGNIIHRIFERILAKDGEVKQIVFEEVYLSILHDWMEVVQAMVQKVLHLELMEGCRLGKIDGRAEIEFLFTDAPHFFKGFVDLTFIWQNRLYILDWKTNYLGDGDACYTDEHLRKAMSDCDYWFQASLYREALTKAWPKIEIGGAFYLFLRGIDSPTNGTLFFQPDPVSLSQRLSWKQ